MSFILDALKKSESERQRQTGPTFATVARGESRQRRLPWPAIIAAVLLVNAVVLGILLLREPEAVVVPAPAGAGPAAVTSEPARTPPPPETQPPVIREAPTPPAPANPPPGATTPAEAASLTAADVPPAGPGAAPRVPAGAMPPAPAPVREPVRSLAEEARAGQAPANAGTETTGAVPERRVQSPGTHPEPAPPAATSALALSTMQIAVAEGRIPGPVLNLDLHVWYPDPARRVVFIEGHKYREGDEIAGGARLMEIVPEGAVLEQRGQRFLLTPR